MQTSQETCFLFLIKRGLHYRCSVMKFSKHFQLFFEAGGLDIYLVDHNVLNPLSKFSEHLRLGKCLWILGVFFHKLENSKRWLMSEDTCLQLILITCFRRKYKICELLQKKGPSHLAFSTAFQYFELHWTTFQKFWFKKYPTKTRWHAFDNPYSFGLCHRVCTKA